MNAVTMAGANSSRRSSTEMELVKSAARGDNAAFADLYRRHSQTGWRLSQAVALTPSESASAFTEGFARALRAVRRRQAPAAQPFRPLLLAGVYRSAIDRLHLPGQPMTSGAPNPGAHSGVSPLTAAAFRSLPDRWRAALWLADVEGLGPERIAPILVVSTAVATQLVSRGRSGLADRFHQAGQPLPEPLGPALRPLAIPLPAALAAVSFQAWQAGLNADPARRFSPAAGWLAERMTRPLSLAIGGILALGLVGAGVLSQRSDLASYGPLAIDGGPAPSHTLGVRNAVPGGRLPSSGFNGDSLLLGPGGVAGGVDLTSSESAGGSPSGSGSTTSPGSPGSGAPTPPAASTITPTTSPRPSTPPASGSSTPPASGSSTPPASGSGSPPASGNGSGSGSDPSTGSGSGSSPGTTVPPPVTVTTSGATIAVPGVLSVGVSPGDGLTVGVGSTPTTTAPPTGSPSTTALPAAPPVSLQALAPNCVLGLHLLGLTLDIGSGCSS